MLLVDRLDDAFDPSQEQFELVSLDRLDLPWGDLFLYQYSILELSTAVKPFLLRYLIDEYKLDSLLYLDPDLYITSPLASVYTALARSSIVLTPHMFAPPPSDGKNPTETDIMLSGVYNLGFLGVVADQNTTNLLEWWSERLASKCVVDLPNALFVDQRWMDLAPSYFNRVEILRDPALNVAYWNLHERKLRQSNGGYEVNGRPLVFFHFSGFNPTNLDILSKHQSRHRPSDNQALMELSKEYADELVESGYKQFSKIPVSFNALENGVCLGKLTQYVVRKGIEQNLPVPSPLRHPDAFSRFLMTPNYLFDKRAIAPILVALEHHRPDVKAAFPQAFESTENVNSIRQWVRSSGGKEEGIAELFDKYGHLLDRVDVVQHALNCWRRRSDLREAFPAAFSPLEGAEAFARWIEQYGTVEDSFAIGDGTAFLARRKGLLRPLMLYLQDNNLQREFKFIFHSEDRNRFVRWLYAEACPRNIVTPEEVAWFDGFAECVPDLVAAIVIGHGTWLHATLVGGGTVYDTRQLRDMLSEIQLRPAAGFMLQLYTSPLGCSLFSQAEQYYYYTPEVRDRFPSVFLDGKNSEKFAELLLERLRTNIGDTAGLASFMPSPTAPRPTGFLHRLRSALRSPSQQKESPAADPRNHEISVETVRKELLTAFARLRENTIGVNLAGYLHAPTGMGESVRSMSRTLAAGSIVRQEIPLPSTHLGPWIDVADLLSGKVIGNYNPAYRVNIIVANGDDYPHVRARLPFAFWKNRRNIGYWVWETESLPESHSDTEGLAEIWTPSEYSAAAIRKAVSIPVRVVPHIIDFDEIDRVAPDRAKFGLRDEQVVFGFFFDCKSVIERKNPLALIAAFRQAFGTSESGPVLLLKASAAEQAPFEFAQIKRAADGLNVVWVTDVLSRTDTLCLMKSLDVYVSLHRSEGFGLTLAESMAMGKPVVASNYSGNVDFMTEQDSCLVQTRVVVTENAHGPYPAGTQWGDPDVDQAAGFLSMLMDHQQRARIGTAAAQAVRRRLDPLAVGHIAAELLSQWEDKQLAKTQAPLPA